MIKLFYKRMIQLSIERACFDQTLFQSNKSDRSPEKEDNISANYLLYKNSIDNYCTF